MRRSFIFEDLSTDEFEDLVVLTCQKKLGIGTFAFATGPDGGRDGKFVGTAAQFPSVAAPHSGKFIIQAKHSSNPTASCSDAEFARVLKGEGPRIEALCAASELEHYLLFTNRKAPADKVTSLEAELIELGPKTAHIIGRENLRLWLTDEPTIWTSLGFDRFDRSFEIAPADLAEVITGFHSALSAPISDDESASDFSYVDKKTKNTINKMSDLYYDNLKTYSLPHFRDIETFLKNPRNRELKELYHDSADEIRQKISAHAALFETFDEALTYVYDLVSGAAALKAKRRFVTVFLHYMYFNCDIGQHA